jgi:beta-glucosidase
MKKSGFPKGFLFGSATSAYQTEGGIVNDWTKWEMKTAKGKVVKAKKKSWPRPVIEQYYGPFDEDNYVSGEACDGYNRFKEDIGIAKSLGQNAYRFSIEWARIEPEEGKFDKVEIEHYRQVIKEIKKHGMEPFLTIWHFTNPVWFGEKGGWANKHSPEYFEKYVKILAEHYSKDVKFWLTINEPEVYATASYLTGMWPPNKHFSYFAVWKNLAEAHKRAFNEIKKIRKDSMVGIAQSVANFEFSSPEWITRPISKIAKWWWNDKFLIKIKNQMDFIGVNYYFSRKFGRQRRNNFISDIGWEIKLNGLRRVLKEITKYKLPIYITENGVADAHDTIRGKFIRKSLLQVGKAIENGVDVRGYFYWSLIDNFEWEKGFWPRFGLVGIDYKNKKREVRGSAKEYKEFIKENSS